MSSRRAKKGPKRGRADRGKEARQRSSPNTPPTHPEAGSLAAPTGPRPPRGKTGAHRFRRFVVLLVPLIAVLAYLPTLTYEFVWDDVTFIEQNPAAHGIAQMDESLSHGYGWVAGEADGIDDALYYRPVVTLINLAHWSLADGEPWLFHLANLITHALAALLLVALALAVGLSPQAALVSGVLFSLHPLASEAVAWISGRTDLGAALFSLALLLLLVRWRSGSFAGGSRSRLILPLLAGITLFCALGSKESAAGILPVALLVLWHPIFGRTASRAGKRPPAAGEQRRSGPGSDPPRWPIVVALLAATAVYVVLRLKVLGGPPQGAEDPLEILPERGPLAARLLLGGNLLLLYLGRLIIPHPLAIDAPLALQAAPYPALPGVIGQLLLLGGGIVLFFWIARARHGEPKPAAPGNPAGTATQSRLGLRQGSPAVILGLALFLVTLLPVLQWLPTPEVYGERFLYLPMAGILLLAAGLIDRWLIGRPTRAVIVTAALGIPALILLQARLPAWHDEIALFRSAAQARPASARAAGHLGSAYMARGALSEAEPHLARALSLDPSDPMLHAKYGSLLVTRGDIDEGVEHLWEAYQAGERSTPTLRNLAVGLTQQGRIAEAGEVLAEALNRDPDDLDLLEGLGNARRMLGRFDEAERIYRRALGLDPNRATVYLNLFGLHYFDRHDPDAARPWGEAFLARFPEAPQATRVRELLVGGQTEP